MRRLLSVVAALALASAVIVAQKAPSTLDVYFIDTEGGQATLLVTPAGQMMLFDTGTAGDNNRDADRITNIIKQTGVEQQLEHVIVSHYHGDHVGNAAEISRRSDHVRYASPPLEVTTSNPGTFALTLSYGYGLGG